MKVPAQVMLSALRLAETVEFSAVTPAELEDDARATEKTMITVAVDPLICAVSERVKELTEGAVVSTTSFRVINAGPVLPAVSV